MHLATVLETIATTARGKSEMGLTLYHFPMSGPSRGALLAAKAVGVEIDIQLVDLFSKHQFSDSFLKVTNLNLQFPIIPALFCSPAQSTAHCANFGGRRLRNLGQSRNWVVFGHSLRKG